MCTEALEQLALYTPGCEAMRCEAAVLHSLEGVAEIGMTEEAKHAASGALLALSDKELVRAEGQKHLMLSYSWAHQAMMKRINESLLRRGYVTWFDCASVRT